MALRFLDEVRGSPPCDDHCIGRRFRTDLAWHEKAIGAGGNGEETMMNQARQKLQAGKAITGAAVGIADAFPIRGARAALDAAHQGREL